MANTYTQIYIQVVFAVNGRLTLINTEHKEEIYKYISGIVRNKGHKLLAINGMSDHIHILLGLKPDTALSDLVRDIKVSSTNFINEKRLARGKFGWQEGFGAFSYGHSQLSTVIRYVQNQESHHRHRTFKNEYLALLQKFDVEFDAKYIFDFMEGDTSRS
ncbi:MAG: IS200/IS605 family transposase [Pyrinomonadaceae bacterium MAG19_C2-C3]|nr:IS200/IS605 family transposase [Pyrinomonadaceae bacterium MAG19_C2-C3]